MQAFVIELFISRISHIHPFEREKINPNIHTTQLKKKQVNYTQNRKDCSLFIAIDVNYTKEKKTKLENRDFQRVNIKHTQIKQGSLSVRKASKQKREKLYIFEYTQQNKNKASENCMTKQTCVETKQTKDDVIC